MTLRHPYPGVSRSVARILLQISVVGLGFGMNLHEVVKAGRTGFIYTAVGISFSMAAGLALGKILRVSGNSSYLITSGTAICGGSAIAAIGPILRASDEEIAVSLGTVFILNSIALLTFPPIGNALHLTQSQFGLWAALAIHDTSSVVGAAAKYGQEALMIGTTVKLARAVDCSAGVGNRSGEAQRKSAGGAAVVHFVFLPGRHGAYLLSGRSEIRRMGVPRGKIRADRHVIFDRYRHFGCDFEERGVAAAFAGRSVVDSGRVGDTVPDPHADYFVLILPISAKV